MAAAYAAYHEEEKGDGGADLLNHAIKNGPFLTSKEADGLIQGLRKEKFFDKMKYDHEKQRWVSIKAKL